VSAVPTRKRARPCKRVTIVTYSVVLKARPSLPDAIAEGTIAVQWAGICVRFATLGASLPAMLEGIGMRSA
jgi:hypothetical protein